jgi:hypothetical protein
VNAVRVLRGSVISGDSSPRVMKSLPATTISWSQSMSLLHSMSLCLLPTPCLSRSNQCPHHACTAATPDMPIFCANCVMNCLLYYSAGQAVSTGSRDQRLLLQPRRSSRSPKSKISRRTVRRHSGRPTRRGSGHKAWSTNQCTPLHRPAASYPQLTRLRLSVWYCTVSGDTCAS